MENFTKKIIVVLGAIIVPLILGLVIYQLNGVYAWWVPAVMVSVGVGMRFVVEYFWP